MTDTMIETDKKATSSAQGLGYGILAYLIWGFFPVYFKQLESVPPLQVVSHRIAWSLLFLALLTGTQKKWQDLWTALRIPRARILLLVTALLIATNWLVFIIAVGHGQVLQSSLGYFITPLVSVLLGCLFLKERLRRLQQLAILLASVGVLLLTVQYGSIPWTALILAVTFGSYGLLRKVVPVDSLTGLTLETLFLAPVAIGYLLFCAADGSGTFPAAALQINLFLTLAGVTTAVPLLLFASAARSLKLATIGFLQYLTPTLHFLQAVILYNEPFTSAHLASFALIWVGLVCYSTDAWYAMQQYRRARH